MKKILFVNFSLNIGGIENFMINVLNNIDCQKYNITFLCLKNGTYDYEEQIKSNGSKIIKLNENLNNHLKVIKAIEKILIEESIDIVHDNTYFYSLHSLIAAKNVGIKIRISHSHTSQAYYEKGLFKKLKHSVVRMLLKQNATHLIACGKEAGDSIFGKNNYQIINNGVDIKKYKKDLKVKEQLKNKYNIPKNCFVIGHVGRLEDVKNHQFLINIFEEYYKDNKNAYLVMIGNGSLKEKLMAQIKEISLNNVIFITHLKTVNEYYNLFDMFVMPSKFEGFPLVLVEAQINELKCLVSNKVSESVKLSDLVEFENINLHKEQWTKHINEFRNKKIDNKYSFENSVYDINTTIKELEKIYKEVV